MSNTMTGREVLRAIADGADPSEFEIIGSSGQAMPFDPTSATVAGMAAAQLVYRRKPRTINIRGFDVPAPEPADRLIPVGVEFYVPDVASETLYTRMKWVQSGIDIVLLRRGLVYFNRDDAIAAAKAMCGIDPSTKE